MPKPELDLATLVKHVGLKGISFFEINAKRDDVPQLEEPADADGDEVKSLQYLQTAHADDNAGFRIRIRTEIVLPDGGVTVDAAVEYSLRDDYRAADISQDLMLEFTNDVAVMQLLPFLRQAVADVTQRVFGAPLLMPMLQRGDMVFRVERRASDVSAST